MSIRMQEQDFKNSKTTAFILSSKEPLKRHQQLELYQNIIAFANEQYKKNEYWCILYTVLKIQNKNVFKALLSYLIEAKSKPPSIEQQLKTLLFNYIENNESKFKKTVIKQLLKEDTNILSQLITICRSSQPKAKRFLLQINETLIQIMYESPVTNLYFTHTCLLALKCIQVAEQASNSLIQESLRHLLIIECIQKGQIAKIILQNEEILDKLNIIGRKQSISGFWYYLISKLYFQQSNQTFAHFEILSKIAESAFTRAVQVIQTDKDMSEEIDKITYSSLSETEKLNCLHQLRGLVFFISSFIQLCLNQGKRDPKYFQIIFRLMQIKDFMCFQYSIKAFIDIANIQNFQIDPFVVKSIQSNCLPIFNPHEKTTYDATELNFYSLSFQDKKQIKISKKSSQMMDRTLEILMQSRGCKDKHKICTCCEQYIHSTIEKQYDNDFNAHEFMSACHLMCRQIIRVTETSPNQAQIESLKDYLITNLKWLLNLNQSCLPQYRKCINFRIFDLMISFPPIFAKNQFLQKVIDDLLVSKLPYSTKHLKQLIQFYQSQTIQSNGCAMISEENKEDLKILGDNIVKKCQQIVFKYDEGVQIWDLIISIFEKDERKLLQLLETTHQNQNHIIAIYAGLKKRKLKNIYERLDPKLAEMQQTMHQNPIFYAEELLQIKMHLIHL